MLTLIFGNNHNLEEWEQVHTEIGLENEKIHNRGKLSSQAISVVWQKIIQIWNWEIMDLWSQFVLFEHSSSVQYHVPSHYYYKGKCMS